MTTSISHVLPALIRRFHDAKISRGRLRHLLGHRLPAPRIPLRRRPRRRLPLPHGTLQRRNIRQHRLRQRESNAIGRVRETNRGLPRRNRLGHFETRWPLPEDLDSSRILALGWKPRTDLETGIRFAYEDYQRRLRDSTPLSA